MRYVKALWILISTLFLSFFAPYVPAQWLTWETYMQGGATAFERGRYADAERQFSVALKAAEQFGPQDLRLALSLANLAGLYMAQGRYAEAEPLFQRTLAIWKKVLGPEHPHVVKVQENYADLLRKMGRKPTHKDCIESFYTSSSARTWPAAKVR